MKRHAYTGQELVLYKGPLVDFASKFTRVAELPLPETAP